jgi:hypothetical protein
VIPVPGHNDIEYFSAGAPNAGTVNINDPGAVARQRLNENRVLDLSSAWHDEP